MDAVPMVNGKYVYIHDGHEGPFQVIDAHHILVQTSIVRGTLLYLTILFLVANICYLLLLKEKPGVFFLWIILIGIFVVKALRGKSIKKGKLIQFLSFSLMWGWVIQDLYWRGILTLTNSVVNHFSILSLDYINSLSGIPLIRESVVIMPGFGVQLETHFGSGRVVHRFVPIGKILKPVLNECVTPVTCYWSLAFIVCGEAELMLVFQKLRPPVKMLVPIWKALRAATDSEESTDTVVEDDRAENQL